MRTITIHKLLLSPAPAQAVLATISHVVNDKTAAWTVDSSAVSVNPDGTLTTPFTLSGSWAGGDTVYLRAKTACSTAAYDAELALAVPADVTPPPPAPTPITIYNDYGGSLEPLVNTQSLGLVATGSSITPARTLTPNGGTMLLSAPRRPIGTPPAYPSIPSVTGLIWYVDPTAATNGNGKGDPSLGLNQTGSTGGTPFNSMAAVKSAMNAGTILPGHQVLTKRGTSLKMKVDFSNFNNSAFLKFGAYGPGTDPLFEYDLVNGSSTAAKDRTMIYAVNASYFFFENIHFTDSTMADNVHTLDCNVGYGVAASDSNCHHWFFNNCSFNKLGEGGEFHGHHHFFVGCTFYDMRYQKNINDPGDFGAVGATMSSATDSLFYGCTFRDCYGKSQYFGWDGGAIEVIGDCSRLKVKYCTVINCEGFIEAGNGSVNIADVFISFNLLVNCSRSLWLNYGTGQPTYSNWQLFNNTFVELWGLQNVSPYPETAGQYRIPNGYLFGIGGAPGTANILNLRNNIFHLVDANFRIATTNMATGTQVTHYNNAYRMPSTAKINYAIVDGSSNPINGELFVGGANVLTDITNADPLQWNVLPPAGAAVIDAGLDLSTIVVNATMPTQDYYGQFTSNAPAPVIGAALKNQATGFTVTYNYAASQPTVVETFGQGFALPADLDSVLSMRLKAPVPAAPQTIFNDYGQTIQVYVTAKSLGVITAQGTLTPAPGLMPASAVMVINLTGQAPGANFQIQYVYAASQTTVQHTFGTGFALPADMASVIAIHVQAMPPATPTGKGVTGINTKTVLVTVTTNGIATDLQPSSSSTAIYLNAGMTLTLSQPCTLEWIQTMGSSPVVVGSASGSSFTIPDTTNINYIRLS